MDRCSYRRIISGNEGDPSPATAAPMGDPSPSPPHPPGLRQIEVIHTASWRFLLFSGEFTTHLRVEEEEVPPGSTDGPEGAGASPAYLMRFDLMPGSSILSKFHGEWHIRQHPTDPHSSLSTLDQVRANQTPTMSMPEGHFHCKFIESPVLLVLFFTVYT